MSRRENGQFRCIRCRMLGLLCVCSMIPSPRLTTRTKLLLVIHRYEDRKSTNTGRLATECLENSEVLVRGHEDSPTPPFECSEGREPLLLFPSEDATPLPRLVPFERPVTLIVPDGNWRQASKVRKRVPGLRDVRCVTLPQEARSTYRLRSEAHETGLSTLEAIARAFGILEGPHVRAALEHVFHSMVERTLWSRGDMATADVTGGVPAGTMRHDPAAPFRTKSPPG